MDLHHDGNIFQCLSFHGIEELVKIAAVSRLWFKICKKIVDIRVKSEHVQMNLSTMMPLNGAPEWHQLGWHYEREKNRMEGLQKVKHLSPAESSMRARRLCDACFLVDFNEIKQLLSVNGCDVLQCVSCDYDDQPWEDSPLGHAIATKHGSQADRLRVARLLMRYGAEVDQVAPYGSTALHNAAQQGCLILVRFLVLMCGADVALPSTGGLTALDWTQGGLHEDYDGNEDDRVAVAAFLEEEMLNPV